MRQSETFLKLYRDYETILRERGIDPKDYEEKVSDTIGGRLRMCRMFRNYLAHNNDEGFLEVSTAQLKFLSQYISTLKTDEDILKKHIKTVAAGMCEEKDKCCDALTKISKLKTSTIVVMTKDGPKTASFYDIVPVYMNSKAGKLSDVKMSKDYIISDKLAKMCDLPKDRIIICTEDGTLSSKVLGVFYPKHI